MWRYVCPQLLFSIGLFGIFSKTSLGQISSNIDYSWKWFTIQLLFSGPFALYCHLSFKWKHSIFKAIFILDYYWLFLVKPEETFKTWFEQIYICVVSCNMFNFCKGRLCVIKPWIRLWRIILQKHIILNQFRLYGRNLNWSRLPRNLKLWQQKLSTEELRH